MSEKRMTELVITVVETAATISAKLGFRKSDQKP
jgi:hypothetical protein